jgi:FKBP-type peptidyl-prolyl cis-trans isomerase FkpA
MIKNLIRYATLALCIGSTLSCTQQNTPKLETEDQKTLYALGQILGRQVSPFELTAEELAIVKAGLTDSVTKAKPQVEVDKYGPLVQELFQKRMAAAAENAQKEAPDAKKKGQEFADNVAKQSNATKTDSGIVIRTITPGTGPSPTETDIVKVHYEGKLIDGKVFDSSIQRNEPAEFQLGRVVPCWREAVQKLKKGEKAQIVCPSELAYGDAGNPPDIPPGATLSFEVELLDFKKP